jgi:uncharacterized protein YjbI with pentapeptide repeats
VQVDLRGAEFVSADLRDARLVGADVLYRCHQRGSSSTSWRW